jgi:hypothetical protein
MLTCLQDYIGLSYCSDGAYTAPASGIYLSSMPGLNIESIDKIADAEQVTYLGVWADVQTSAIPDYRSDVISEIMKCYKINCECDYDELICENLDILAQSFKYKLAIWLLIFRINTSRLNRFTTVDLQQAKELKDFYQLEYEKMLKQEVLCMDVSACQLCCGGNPEVVTWLP